MLSTLFWKDRDEIWEDQGGLGVWYRQGKGEEEQTTVNHGRDWSLCV